MRYYLVVILITLFPLYSLSAPYISNVSGTYTDGSIVTIVGIGFEASSYGIPIKYDLFQQSGGAYDDGDIITNGWIPQGDSGVAIAPRYDTDNARFVGGKHIICEYYSGKYSGEFYYGTGSGIERMYISYWFRRSHTGTDSGNRKYFGLSYNPISTDNNPYLFAHEYTSSILRFLVRQCDGSYFETFDHPLGADIENTWERMEFYVEANTPGVANGVGQVWIQHGGVGNTFTQHVNEIDMEYYNSGCTREWMYVTFGNYVAPITGAYYYHYFDDVYINNSRTRVELGDSSVWALCTHREIQPPVVWNSGQVQITLNTGSFSNGYAYLYIIDDDGVVSNSYAIILGTDPGDETSPNLVNLVPVEDATNVSKSTNISFTLTDDVSGVDKEEIILNVNGVNHCASDMVGTCPAGGIKDLTVTGDILTYNILYNPSSDFNYGEVIEVYIEAADLSVPQRIMPQKYYTFTIESYVEAAEGAASIITTGTSNVIANGTGTTIQGL